MVIRDRIEAYIQLGADFRFSIEMNNIFGRFIALNESASIIIWVQVSKAIRMKLELVSIYLIITSIIIAQIVADIDIIEHDLRNLVLFWHTYAFNA